MAAYTQCLRCTGAPRRPAGGSGLSLHIPSWHAVLSDPGELDIDNFQNIDVDFGLRRVLNGSALPNIPAIRFTRGRAFGASLVRFRYGLSGCLPPCTDLTETLSHRGLLLPGFQRIGLPPRCWI